MEKCVPEFFHDLSLLFDQQATAIMTIKLSSELFYRKITSSDPSFLMWRQKRGAIHKRTTDFTDARFALIMNERLSD